MNVKVEEISHAVGIIFPKEAKLKVGDEFTLHKQINGFLLTPKLKNNYHTDAFWGDVASEKNPEDVAWDEFSHLPSELDN